MNVAIWRHVARIVASVLLVSWALFPALLVQAQPPLAWWKSPQFQRELELTTDQVAKVEAIFQATLPELRAKRDELDRFEIKLSNLIEADADEAAVARWLDKTEAARGGLNKVRTLMLMRMRQVLTPEQRVRFKALHEERDRNRHQGSRRSPAGPGKQ